MWRRSCLRRTLRRAVTIFQTLRAQKTTAAASLKRAGEEGGCEEVLCTEYRIIFNALCVATSVVSGCHVQELGTQA